MVGRSVEGWKSAEGQGPYPQNLKIMKKKNVWVDLEKVEKVPVGWKSAEAQGPYPYRTWKYEKWCLFIDDSSNDVELENQST